MSEALRKAAEKALESLKTAVTFANHMGIGDWQQTAMTCHESIAALRAALAEPEQSEPVAWVWRFPNGDLGETPYERKKECEADWAEFDGEAIPLYAAPPRREPLTDEQLWANDVIMSLNADLGWHMETIRMFARAIEAAHGVGGRP